jgi:hypothetical protein
LQRRVVDDGSTFRQLLLEARQELAREYLNRTDIDVAEVAYLLGYEDSNSFYRAFRTWEGTTPSQLRQSSNDLLTRQQREVFMDKVWLVTGSASGLGRNIAEAVLESGDRLVATARDPRRLDDLVNKFGERVRAVSLDVADERYAE